MRASLKRFDFCFRSRKSLLVANVVVLFVLVVLKCPQLFFVLAVECFVACVWGTVFPALMLTYAEFDSARDIMRFVSYRLTLIFMLAVIMTFAVALFSAIYATLEPEKSRVPLIFNILCAVVGGAVLFYSVAMSIVPEVASEYVMDLSAPLIFLLSAVMALFLSVMTIVTLIKVRDMLTEAKRSLIVMLVLSLITFALLVPTFAWSLVENLDMSLGSEFVDAQTITFVAASAFVVATAVVYLFLKARAPAKQKLSSSAYVPLDDEPKIEGDQKSDPYSSILQ